MEMSGQFHASAALPPGKGPPVPVLKYIGNMNFAIGFYEKGRSRKERIKERQKQLREERRRREMEIVCSVYRSFTAVQGR